MRKRILPVAGLILLAGLFSGCNEGMEISDNVSINMETEPADTEQQKSPGKLHAGAGIYEVEKWSIYNTLSETEIPHEALAPNNNFSKNVIPANILLVTVKRTSTSDYYGELEETVYTNEFLPVTQDDIDASYLPESEPDVVPRLFLAHGQEAIYLNIGNVGKNNYFEINAPIKDDSITYILGFSLSDSEYRAAEKGTLYLWYSLDEAQAKENLQLLSLPLDLNTE